jgi:hypothetical protein
MSERPPASLSALGSAAIRPMEAADYPAVRSLWLEGNNPTIASTLAVDDAAFIAAARSGPWASPMMLLENGAPTGAAIVGAADLHHRNGRLIVLARQPREAALHLGLYIRHVFWSYPLHRLYALLPGQVPGAPGYAALLHACGFIDEGRLVRHQRVGTRMLDLDVYGLLRPDFDAWCRDHRPDWSLQ